MNKYLLLRDNKQTGPHALDEMLSLGFKKYDLVWVEGKSAAWRYPGELEEFKHIAPLVEEQPFDRFFKKSSPLKKDESTYVPNPLEEKPAPIQELKTQKKNITAFTSSNVAEHEKFMPRESRQNNPDPQEKSVRAHHKYVSVTLPSNRSATPEGSKQPEPLQEVKLPPVRMEMPMKRPGQAGLIVPPPSGTLPPQKMNALLQYSGVAAALISLLVVGILIGMGVSNQPPIEPPYLPSEPSRITELKEKLVTQAEPRVPPIPVVNQQYRPQQPSEFYPEPTPSPSPKSATRSTAAKAPMNNKESNFRNTKDPQGLIQPQAPADSAGKRMAVKRGDTPLQSSGPSSDISKHIDLSLNQYKVGMFGGIENIEVTLKNGSDIKLNEAIVEVRYILSNRKHLTETLRFENIEPGASLTLTAPDSERGIRLETRIIKLTD
jgi:hypothetical protein